MVIIGILGMLVYFRFFSGPFRDDMTQPGHRLGIAMLISGGPR